jgi:hypothetical protein
VRDLRTAHIQWEPEDKRAELEACDWWAVQGKRIRVLQKATLEKELKDPRALLARNQMDLWAVDNVRSEEELDNLARNAPHEILEI